MKLGILLAVMLSASSAQSQPLADSSSWYVLIGKHKEPWSLCYANIVAKKFKDGTHVDAEAEESANRDVDLQCKMIPPTAEQKAKEKECNEAQKAEKQVRERIEKGISAAGVMPLSYFEASTRAACSQVRLLPRYVGGVGGCSNARFVLEFSQVLTVTKRLGPYPSAEQAADELRADGWRMGTNPISGGPIWFKKYGCNKDPQ